MYSPVYEPPQRPNPDAEPLSFEDCLDPPDTIRSRVERQSGGGKVPEQLATFGQLYNAAEFNPFENLEVVPHTFPFPDPRHCGASRAAKITGNTHVH